MKHSTFVVLSNGDTLEKDVSIESEYQRGITGDNSAIGYFEHNGCCVKVVEKFSQRGRPYWKEDSSSKLNGVRCEKRGHIH